MVVIAASITHGASAKIGLEYGVHKVGEVVFGCLVGLLVSLAMSKRWLVQPSPELTESSSRKK